ncbi:hypothetical protein LXL04_009871 [Taraxacum kok-saghyz]
MANNRGGHKVLQRDLRPRPSKYYNRNYLKVDVGNNKFEAFKKAYVEAVNHLFFSCEMAFDLWALLGRWWGVHVPVLSSMDDYIGLGVRDALETVFLVVMWSLWNFRNAGLFSNSKPVKTAIWDSIQSQSFWWYNARNFKFKVSWVDWLCNPILAFRDSGHRTISERKKSGEENAGLWLGDSTTNITCWNVREETRRKKENLFAGNLIALMIFALAIHFPWLAVNLIAHLTNSSSFSFEISSCALNTCSFNPSITFPIVSILPLDSLITRLRSATLPFSASSRPFSSVKSRICSHKLTASFSRSEILSVYLPTSSVTSFLDSDSFAIPSSITTNGRKLWRDVETPPQSFGDGAMVRWRDVRMAEWSKAPDSSSGLRKRAWVQIPLLCSDTCFIGELNEDWSGGGCVLFSIALFFFCFILRGGPQSI